jgi:contractile injection system tube protein
MPNSQPLVKARLLELNVSMKDEQPGGKQVTVQFNPETLKVSFTNQIGSAGGRRDESSASAQQAPPTGTAKLSVQLWFDVTAPLPAGQGGTDDVRTLTKELIHFVTPRERGSGDAPTAPPGVRFVWGSFQFDGLVDSLEESLEFFSPEGRPLRAGVTLSVTQTQTQKVTFAGGGVPGAGGLPGTAPLVTATAGASLQSLAAGAGVGGDWQKIAAANGIENPRLLAPGQLIDLRVR